MSASKISKKGTNEIKTLKKQLANKTLKSIH